MVSASDATETTYGRRVASREFTTADRHPPASLTVALGAKNAHLDLLVKMVPFVPDGSARIVGTYLRTKMTNFASGSESNGALF